MESHEIESHLNSLGFPVEQYDSVDEACEAAWEGMIEDEVVTSDDEETYYRLEWVIQEMWDLAEATLCGKLSSDLIQLAGRFVVGKTPQEFIEEARGRHGATGERLSLCLQEQIDAIKAQPVKRITTGLPELDELAGGGIPVGKITSLAAKEEPPVTLGEVLEAKLAEQEAEETEEAPEAPVYVSKATRELEALLAASREEDKHCAPLNAYLDSLGQEDLGRLERLLFERLHGED